MTPYGTMKAWHFLKDDGKLRWRCGNVQRPQIGETLTVNPDKLQMCSYGLHASAKVLDALKYAPGSLLCRVELGGKIIKDTNKLCASERTIIAQVDAAEMLHWFACWCARRALKQVKNPDHRSITAIETKETWLRGEASDQELAAAAEAATEAAAEAAEGAAAEAAEGAAAGAAAAWAWASRAAARASRAAARAARTASWAAAGAAERQAQSRHLTRQANKLMEGTWKP